MPDKNRTSETLVLQLMDLDDPVCLCFQVTKRKVMAFLRVEKPQHPAQLSECFGAGTGCGWCRPYLVRLFQQPESKADAPEDLTHEEYARRRQEYLRSKEDEADRDC